MKYLDEQIVEQITGTIAGTSTGIYQYKVLRKNDSDNSYTTIFVGNMYHQYGTAFKVDITDIIRNDIWVPNEDSIYSTSDITAQSIKLVNTYKVDFIVGGTSYRTNGVQVAKVYRYQHILNYMTSNLFFNYETTSNSVSFPLQGRYTSGGKGYYHLLPRYPYKSTDNYKMILVSEDSLDYTSGTMNISGEILNSKSVTFTPPATLSTISLTNLYNGSIYHVFGGSFGTSHYGQNHSFNIIQETGGIKIQALQQDDLYVKFVILNAGRDISSELTGWIQGGDEESFQLTLNTTFLLANRLGLLAVLLSPTAGQITNADSVDWLEYHFNLPTNSTLINGKTVDYTIYPRQLSWMSKWQLKNINLTIPMTSDKTLVEVAGDYIAEIDYGCYSRYYLQWQDRMGAFQSQPFNEHYTYSEKINRETITNYNGIKRVSNVNVTPKFKINTDWIKEDLYPYYESIFTSPILFLYDTQEDKLYSVLVTDSEYTEKTYDNQKKLFNLSLNLELNKQQTMIY